MGVHSQIHRIGERVIIYSDDGSIVHQSLPHLVNEVKKLEPFHTFVLDTEIELWSGGEHQPREKISGVMHSNGQKSDSEMVSNVFDVLYAEWGGQIEGLDKKGDLHKLPYSERLKYLDALKIPMNEINKPDFSKGHLNKAPTVLTNNEKKIREAVDRFAKSDASEGAMVKILSGTYPLGGSSSKVIKYKKYGEAHVVVLHVNHTKNPGVYNYDAGVPFSTEKIDPRFIYKLNGKEYTVVALSYNTDIKCQPGDIITLRFHNVNHYKNPDTGVERLHLYEPIFYEKRSPTEDPDTFQTVLNTAKNAGLLVEKESDKIRTEQIKSSIFNSYPARTGKFPYVAQHHFRGATCHVDLRIKYSATQLVGYTIDDLKPGTIKKPVLTLQDAKRIDSNPSQHFKINWKTGEPDKKQRGSKDVYVEIVSQVKKPEPTEWLTFEGITPPGDVGATKNFPGVFHIIDKGDAEFGAIKPWAKEFFLWGHLNGRFLFRELKNVWKYEKSMMDFEKFLKFILISNEEYLLDEDLEDIIKMQIPKGNESSPGFGNKITGWVFIKPLEQLPYVLSRRALNKKWVPPSGYSAMPQYIMEQIPDEYKFWKKASPLTIRNQLFDLIKKKEITIKLR